MRELGLEVVQPRGYLVTTMQGEDHDYSDDLLNRTSPSTSPARIWLETSPTGGPLKGIAHSARHRLGPAHAGGMADHRPYAHQFGKKRPGDGATTWRSAVRGDL